MNKRGFTILEVLVAILIIAFGLLALMRTLSGGLVGGKRGHDVTIATLLAQQKMEELRYSAWPATVTDADGIFDTPNNNFDWQMTVGNTGTTNLREVSLSIYWPADLGNPDDRSKQRSLNITTYMAKYD